MRVVREIQRPGAIGTGHRGILESYIGGRIRAWKVGLPLNKGNRTAVRTVLNMETDKVRHVIGSAAIRLVIAKVTAGTCGLRITVPNINVRVKLRRCQRFREIRNSKRIRRRSLVDPEIVRDDVI